MSPDGAGRGRADASVARRFSRAMRAATVPWGMLCDPALVGVGVAVTSMAAAVARGAPGVLRVALALAPVAVGVLASVATLGARARVVDWLASLPFPVDNVNALLNGIGAKLLIRFSSAPPERSSLNALLERLHEDCFTLEYHDEGGPSGAPVAGTVVEVAIGVPDSKLNPTRAAHRRYTRVRAIVESCLVPLHQEHPIVSIWIA